jgi:hypothetical protein
MASMVPQKMIISDEVFTISGLDLFRDASRTYLPIDRAKPTVYENYESPTSLNLHVAAFVVPVRTPIENLCEFSSLPGTLRNVYLTTGGINKEYWGNWDVLDETKQLGMPTCQVEDFDASVCTTLEGLREKSRNRYRLLCTSSLRPRKVLTSTTAVPVSLKWKLPDEARDDGTRNLPEFTADVESIFHLGYNDQVMEVEKAYMSSASSQEAGERILWAGATAVHGHAECDADEVWECDAGMPANVPVVIPTISVELNMDRTVETLLATKPLHWPTDPDELDQLLHQKFKVGLSQAISAATNTEDGGMSLHPQTRYLIEVSMRIDAIYKSDHFGRMKINRWAFSVDAVKTEQQKLDYAARSQAMIRYKLHLLPGSQRIQDKYAYDFNDLVTDSGSWAGIWGLGLTLLATWQSYALPFGSCGGGDAEAEQQESTRKKFEKKLKKIEWYFLKFGYAPRTAESAAPVRGGDGGLWQFAPTKKL